MGQACSCYEGDGFESSYGNMGTIKRQGYTATALKKKNLQQYKEMQEKMNRQNQLFQDYEFPATLDQI